MAGGGGELRVVHKRSPSEAVERVHTGRQIGSSIPQSAVNKTYVYYLFNNMVAMWLEHNGLQKLTFAAWQILLFPIISQPWPSYDVVQTDQLGSVLGLHPDDHECNP